MFVGVFLIQNFWILGQSHQLAEGCQQFYCTSKKTQFSATQIFRWHISILKPGGHFVQGCTNSSPYWTVLVHGNIFMVEFLIYFLKIISDAMGCNHLLVFLCDSSSSVEVEMLFPRIFFRLKAHVWCSFLDVHVIFIKVNLLSTLHFLSQNPCKSIQWCKSIF